RDPLLDRDVGEQRAAALLLASHQQSCGCFIFADVAGFFSKLLNPTPPTTPPTTGVDDLSALAMPTFPTPTSLGDPTSRDPNAVTVTAAITQANDDVYPYSTAVPGTISGVSAALRPECKLNSGSTAINCLVNTISTTANNARIRIDTSYYPVNIFVRGAISFQRGSEIGAKPVINNTSVSDWNKLRIYGNNSGSSCATQSTANSFTQSISVGGSAAFKGAFSWFPKARISYGTGGGGGSDVTNFGIMWICRFDGPGSENQAWGAPLDASAGIGTIFGTAFGGSSDTLTPSAIPSSPSYYRSYGAS
ncbi:hypothetical protein, partial [Synechococcus sp. BA-132 BA5]|uniref:hypothetical protein n=1 Tax=Synechococcus sp. BA-132 BA5 TaxID=3110252 RepID=UPI002B20B6E1